LAFKNLEERQAAAMSAGVRLFSGWLVDRNIGNALCMRYNSNQFGQRSNTDERPAS